MEKIEFNKCQTPLEDLRLDTYPKEVQEQWWNFLNNVPFIRWMVSKDRPLVSELPRDDEGKEIPAEDVVTIEAGEAAGAITIKNISLTEEKNVSI